MPLRIPLTDRISLDEKTGCWNWKGSHRPKGYGLTCYKGKQIGAHRLSAVLWLNLSPGDSRHVCHRCDNPRCFNPKHLFVGTRFDNMRDAASKGHMSAPKKKVTHCKRGHIFDEANTRYRKTGRRCRKCENMWKSRDQKVHHIARNAHARERYAFKKLAS